MRISDWSSDVCSSDLVVFEGVPTYPHVGRFWEMIQRHKVTVFYTAPTAIRSLTKAAEGAPEYHPREYDLGSLRIIGSVGEPINPEAWMWYYTNVGRERCPVLDTWWQTETGAHMITPLPGVTPLKRSEERRVGKDSVRTCRARGS